MSVINNILVSMGLRKAPKQETEKIEPKLLVNALKEQQVTGFLLERDYGYSGGQPLQIEKVRMNISDGSFFMIKKTQFATGDFSFYWWKNLGVPIHISDCQSIAIAKKACDLNLTWFKLEHQKLQFILDIAHEEH